MAKMRTYGIYILWIVLGILLSNFLIAVGLNSNYKQIYNIDENNPRIEIVQSEATKVNGRIRGIIHNDEKESIEEKYLKIDLYSARDVNMGNTYIEIDKTQEDMPFEAFFKLNNVSYFKTSFVNEKDPQGEIELLPKDLKKSDIIFATIVALLIFK